MAVFVSNPVNSSPICCKQGPVIAERMVSPLPVTSRLSLGRITLLGNKVAEKYDAVREPQSPPKRITYCNIAGIAGALSVGSGFAYPRYYWYVNVTYMIHGLKLLSRSAATQIQVLRLYTSVKSLPTDRRSPQTHQHSVCPVK